MYSDSDSGEGGFRNIIPTARRGIHDQNRNQLKNSGVIMSTRKTISNQIPSTLNQESCDEVDNIFSKPVPSSPIILRPATNRRTIPRRSSVDAELTDTSSESEDQCILSKSSPAIISTYSSHSRNEISIQYHNDCLSSNDTSGSSYTSYQNVSKSQPMSTQPQTDSHAPGIVLESSRQINSYPRNNVTESRSNLNIYYWFAAVFVIIAILLYYQYYGEKITETNNYDRFSFYKDVKSLGHKYKIKQDSVLQIQTGIDTIFEKEDTGSFIFTYDGNAEGFDPVQFNSFMDNISITAARYLRNSSKSIQHVVLDNSKVISLKSDTDLINEFREYVDKTGVFLVKNLERIPSELSMAFHYYCDEYNPLVKKSAIFFTLNVAKCTIPSRQKSMHDYIERCLKTKWKDVDNDKIGPLLTRIVNIIIDLTNI